MKSFISKILLAASICVCTSSNAAIILNGSTTVGSFNATGSITDFYGYNTAAAFSSNTGFEINDTFVFMLVEAGGTNYLVGTTDGTSVTGDNSNGRVNITLDDNTGAAGGLVFVDDSNDTVISSTNSDFIDFIFGNPANDGFIYDLGDTMDLSLDGTISLVNGITSSVFLNFTDDGLAVLNIGSTFDLTSQEAVTVPTPSTLIFTSMALFLSFFAGRRNK